MTPFWNPNKHTFNQIDAILKDRIKPALMLALSEATGLGIDLYFVDALWNSLRNEEHERQEYERLKAKFEKGENDDANA